MKRRDFLKASSMLSIAKVLKIKFEFPLYVKVGRGSPWLVDNLGLQLHAGEKGEKVTQCEARR